MNNRVLYIDDDRRVRDVAARVLWASGFEVTTATGNDEALDFLEKEPQAFGVVVQDCQRPLGRCLMDMGPSEGLNDLSGLFFLRRHVWRLNPEMPCIMVTMDPLRVLYRRDPGLMGNPLFHYLPKRGLVKALVEAVWDVGGQAEKGSGILGRG